MISLVEGWLAVRVKLEAGGQLLEDGGRAFEDVVDVVAGIQFAGDIGEVAAVHLLDGLDSGAIFGEIDFEAFDEFFGAFVAAFGVEDEQCFVTVLHVCS